MLRLKRVWRKQYLEKNRVSKQKLRDNAARFKKEFEMNVGSEKKQIEIEMMQLWTTLTSGQRK